SAAGASAWAANSASSSTCDTMTSGSMPAPRSTESRPEDAEPRTTRVISAVLRASGSSTPHVGALQQGDPLPAGDRVAQLVDRVAPGVEFLRAGRMLTPA